MTTLGIEVFEGVLYDSSHGSPFDRGSSDYYYHRKPVPHKWLDSGGYQRVELADADEIAAYMAGYRSAVEQGIQKEYCHWSERL